MNHKVDALRRQTIQAHCGQVYKIIWQAHQEGEPWLYHGDIAERMKSKHQVDLSKGNMDAILRHLRDKGYLKTVRQSNNKAKWHLHPQAVGKSEFGEPLSAEWSDCKTIQVDPRLAASSKAATASFTELEQYSREAVK